MRTLRPVLFFCCLLSATLAPAAPRAEYRGFWVDTFNSTLNNQADVSALVERAKAAKANVLFVQVRRRGDSWYLNSLEPPPDFVPIESGFDPLQSLIQTAHLNGIEVHAFVIAGAVWNKNPAFAPTATLGPPTSAAHVFNRHGGFDPATGRIEPGPENWLTRTLLPDGAAGIGFQGHRFGSEFWLDFGHPGAAAYTVDVLMHLVRHYDIDGLHLDRIRFPEFSAAGQTQASGANVGYNAVSVRRFQAFHGLPFDAPPPEPGDVRWAQWRRDQVTNLVRRVYLNAIAIRPRLVVSAALITFGSGPTTEDAWRSAEAYWRVYQDWRAWLEEGIIDLAIPMNYKRENVAQQAAWFDQWNEWTRTHLYGRAALSGLGVYLNSIEGSLRQVRRSLMASLPGVVFYAMANPDAAVAGNPHALPPGSDTPVRGFAEFAAALTEGKYESPEMRPPVFAEDAVLPRLPWKAAPTTGHLMGHARSGGEPLDSAAAYIYNSEGRIERAVRADGGGFFGAVDLPPGEYAVIVVHRDRGWVSNVLTVEAGRVAEAVFP